MAQGIVAQRQKHTSSIALEHPFNPCQWRATSLRGSLKLSSQKQLRQSKAVFIVNDTPLPCNRIECNCKLQPDIARALQHERALIMIRDFRNCSWRRCANARVHVRTCT
jgi:hypothetical protein